MLSLVFEEYQQLAPLSSTGTGLGLSIVKRTTDLLGHSLDVHSTLGRGSCFTVEVPTRLNSTAANARLRHVA
jgi:signal transduction histidine kinase